MADVASVTAPRRSLLGRLLAAATARRPARPRRPGRAAAFAVKAREHLVTVAALGAFDLGAFQLDIPHAGSAPGWAAVCLTLLALDLAVTGK